MVPQAASLTPAAGALLRKPDLPRKPPKPDQRTGSQVAKAARQQNYDMLLCEYELAKREYDDVLYPEYRAAKKKAVRPGDDGARAVQRRKANTKAAANHKRREQQRRARDEQLRVMELCRQAIGCSFTLDGSDYLRLWNMCDKPMLRAVLEWETDHWPDGSQAWWLAFCQTAKAAQSKQQTLRHTLGYGLSAGSICIELVHGPPRCCAKRRVNCVRLRAALSMIHKHDCMKLVETRMQYCVACSTQAHSGEKAAVEAPALC